MEGYVRCRSCVVFFGVFLATPTLAAWLADCAHLIAETHPQDYPFGANSRASQSRSICLVHLHCLLGLLEYCGKTLTVSLAAHYSISRESRQLLTPSNFLIVVFPRYILPEVCLTLSLAPFYF